MDDIIVVIILVVILIALLKTPAESQLQELLNNFQELEKRLDNNIIVQSHEKQELLNKFQQLEKRLDEITIQKNNVQKITFNTEEVINKTKEPEKLLAKIDKTQTLLGKIVMALMLCNDDRSCTGDVWRDLVHNPNACGRDDSNSVYKCIWDALGLSDGEGQVQYLDLPIGSRDGRRQPGLEIMSGVGANFIFD